MIKNPNLIKEDNKVVEAFINGEAVTKTQNYSKDKKKWYNLQVPIEIAKVAKEIANRKEQTLSNYYIDAIKKFNEENSR